MPSSSIKLAEVSSKSVKLDNGAADVSDWGMIWINIKYVIF